MNTISLDLAKKIHEAAKEYGVELPKAKHHEIYLKAKLFADTGTCYTSHENEYGTDELLEMLPHDLPTEYKTRMAPLWLTKGSDYYMAYYENMYTEDHIHGEHGDTPSEALGQMLLYLIENDLFTN